MGDAAAARLPPLPRQGLIEIVSHAEVGLVAVAVTCTVLRGMARPLRPCNARPMRLRLRTIAKVDAVDTHTLAPLGALSAVDAVRPW